MHTTNTPTARPAMTATLRLGTLALAAALAGCASLAPVAPEEAVRNLANQRWQALVAQDFAKAYTYSTPAYRQLRTAAYYKANRQGVPFTWLGAQVIRVDCEEKKCAVRIALESKPISPFGFKGTLSTGLDETWVQEDGQWWLLEAL